MTSRRDRGPWVSIPARDKGPVGIHHGLMLQMNEHLVLDFVHERQTTTRPEIARHLGLSPATVSRIVRRLVDQDLVRERPGISDGGRPPTMVSFNPRSGVVIGIDLGGHTCNGVLADLAGDILLEDIRPTLEAGDPFSTLSAMVERLHASANEIEVGVAGVAIGVPAIVDPRSGSARAGPAVNWEGFPVAEALSERIDVPFVIDNEANLKAFGHAWRGDAVGLDAFVVLSMGTGIGAAIVADGQLLRGRDGSAGEIGYVVLERSQLPGTPPDDRGAFERIAGGQAITEAALLRLAASGDPSLLRGSEEPVTPELIFDAAARDDPLALGIVLEVAELVSMSIVGLAAAVGPELVILDGAIGRALGLVRPQIQEAVDRHLPTGPRIIASSIGDKATVLGAVAAALDLSRSQRAPRALARGGPAPWA